MQNEIEYNKWRKNDTLRQLCKNGFLTTDKISFWPFLLPSARTNYSAIHTQTHSHTYLTIPKSVTDKWCKEYWLHIATVYIFLSKSADILLRRTKEDLQKWAMNSRQEQECSHLHKIHFTCSVIMNETCFTVKVVHTMWCTVCIVIKSQLGYSCMAEPTSRCTELYLHVVGVLLRNKSKWVAEVRRRQGKKF